jgi:1-phosphatidylinositol phosphodiesterase
MRLNTPFHISNAAYKYLFVSGDTDKRDDRDRYAEARPVLRSGDSELPKFLWELRPVENDPLHVYLWNQEHGYLYPSASSKDGSDSIVKAHSSASGSQYHWRLQRSGLWFTIQNKNGSYLFAAGSNVKGGDHVAECGTMALEGDQPALKFRWYIKDWLSLDRWITELNPPPSSSIAALTIPGTHDSATYAPPHPVTRVFAQCQNESFQDQLRHGVRFFDARLRYVGSQLEFYHGPIAMDLPFSRLIDTLLEFLAGTGEFVVLSIDDEESDHPHSEQFAEAVHQVVREHPERWFLGNEIPTYGEVRGKIVLLRRYDARGTAAIGIQARPWRGGAIATIGEGTPNPKICRQDYWELDSSDDFPAKWEYVEQQLIDARDGSRPYVLYLNFTSAAGKLKHEGDPVPLAVAQYVHPRLYAYLRQHPRGRYGVVLVDFLSKEMGAQIVAANDFEP